MVIWLDKSGEEPSEQVPIGREGTMILGDHCFPGGLGDMPDSQGPNMAEKPIGTGVSDPHSSQASLPSGTNIREGNVQWMYISDMFIGHFPSSSYSPHICGLVVIWGRFRVWYFIFHILGYFRNSKDKCSITSETLLWVLCSCG